jgi:probable HAF family extracellular repeat protein
VRPTILATTFLACAIASAPAAAQTPGFHLVGLAPGTTYSGVSALSQDGQVAVGGSVTRFVVGPDSGFRWTAATGRYDFGLEPGMPRATLATGVSSAGEVIVGYMADPTPDRAYRRVGNGPLENLGLIPGSYTRSYARGVSGDGTVVVGRSEFNISSTTTAQQAFRWTPLTGMQGLGFLSPLGGFRSEALGVSRDGSTIVGTSDSYAFAWKESTGMQPLHGLPGGTAFPQCAAYSTNADGTVIVGFSYAPSGSSDAVRWTPSGIERLGAVPGFAHSYAYAVDDSGDVIGGVVSGGSPDRAFVWTSTGGMSLLSDFLSHHGTLVPQGWHLDRVVAISGDGLTFAGEARSTAGVRQGFVATIPAPSGLLVVFSSALFLVRRRRSAR